MSGKIGGAGSKSRVIGKVNGDIQGIQPWSTSNPNGVSANHYQVVSTTYVTTGIGFSLVTGPHTNKLYIMWSGKAMLYDAAGGQLNGGFKLVHHSDSTTAGAAPSGADITENHELGQYNPNYDSGRHDLYVSFSLNTTMAVTPNTQYHCQLAGKLAAGMNYFHWQNDNGGFLIEATA